MPTPPHRTSLSTHQRDWWQGRKTERFFKSASVLATYSPRSGWRNWEKPSQPPDLILTETAAVYDWVRGRIAEKDPAEAHVRGACVTVMEGDLRETSQELAAFPVCYVMALCHWRRTMSWENPRTQVKRYCGWGGNPRGALSTPGLIVKIKLCLLPPEESGSRPAYIKSSGFTQGYQSNSRGSQNPFSKRSLKNWVSI